MPAPLETAGGVHGKPRMARVAIIAGAVGSMAGAVAVMAAVAAVAVVANTPAENHATAKRALSQPAALPKAALPKDCATYTWPNLPAHCVRRAETPPAAPPAAEPARTSQTAAIAPPELRPGSPAVPAPPPKIETWSAPQPSTQPAPLPVQHAQTPAAETPAHKPAAANPVRKTERSRVAAKPAPHAGEDVDQDDAPQAVTYRRDEPALERTIVRRYVVRQSDAADDFDRPVRRAAPLDFLGALFGLPED